jgi:hypothetical protein
LWAGKYHDVALQERHYELLDWANSLFGLLQKAQHIEVISNVENKRKYQNIGPPWGQADYAPDSTVVQG